MTLLKLSFVVASVLSLGSACTGAKGKADDSATTASADSTPPASPSTPTPAPTPAAPDSGVKNVPAPKPSGSTPAGTPTPQPTPTPSETVLTGKISVGGLAGQEMVSLQIEGAKPARLLGPLAAELQRLNSATVWVAGAPAASPAGAFTVSRYEIVSIDGAKPLVGTTVTRAGALWLAAERDTVKLVAAPSDLTSKVGATVWIVGRRTGADVTVQSFGIIRDP